MSDEESKKYPHHSNIAMELIAKDQNLLSKDQSLGFEDEETKINGVDAFGIINRSPYSNSV